MIPSVPPPGPSAVPAYAAVIRDFVNLRNIRDQRELLSGPEDLVEWLADHLGTPRRLELPPADFLVALGIREGLRDALERHSGEKRVDEGRVDGQRGDAGCMGGDRTIEGRVGEGRVGEACVGEGRAGGEFADEAALRLDEDLARIPLRLSMAGADGGMRLVAADDAPLTLALAPLLDAVRRCGESRVWRRLRICDRSGCRRAYYDGSRGLTRRWCPTGGCGNKVKMRRAYVVRKSLADQDTRQDWDAWGN
ncbi:CGNR zinc finger domain-containing protein [Kineosporia sp. J2-2]|uniref:CGNR zinc finger domain-containing protein n=1 Tax=Kineosporia corallincola TaxID=2835133 RepID=A0ABS5TFG1_9ACTN|nr:CGNR zinc finger domain-containing protein [Kineosporia corallincola]MBT0769583.1 CGNR zinc finger domain-containing protein [Kineosporia corallincola]